MGSRALLTAGIAAGLLVVVLVADSTMNRTYALDVQVDGAWRTLAEHPYRYDESRPYVGLNGDLEANRSEEIRFRLRVDNGYPWAMDETFRVYENGDEVASGQVAAPAQGETTAEFTIPADRILGRNAVSPEGEKFPVGSANIQVDVDGESVNAFVSVREVTA